MTDDNQNLEATAVDTKPDAEPKAPATKKQRSAGRHRSAVEPSKASSKERALSSPVAKPRKYSEKDRNDKLTSIEAKVSDGGSLKDAIKAAGISEQTYYQWKRSAKSTESATVKNDVIPVAAAEVDDELAEFARLDEENQRLRKLLAEKLRAENAELRKRLGMS